MAANVSVGRQDLCGKLSRDCLFRATYMMWAGYLLLHLGNVSPMPVVRDSMAMLSSCISLTVWKLCCVVYVQALFMASRVFRASACLSQLPDTRL